MRCTAYRPRPNNGSGDTPRPPFLTEFVNQIGEVFLVKPIYHLIGGTLAARVHAHVERSFRLKTESALRICELQAAQAQISQNSVNRTDAANLSEARISQLDLRPIAGQLRRRLVEPLAGDLQRCRILIEANQTTRCAEATCNFETVPASAHGRIHIGPTAPYG